MVAEAGMPRGASGALELDGTEVARTVTRLEQRIAARFPQSGLRVMAQDLHVLARETMEQAGRLSRPNRLVQAALATVVLAGAFGAGAAWRLVSPGGISTDTQGLVTMLDAAANLAVLVGAALLSLFTLEARLKRHAAARALHRLRSLIHVIDMRQLTKDPAMIGRTGTSASPVRSLGRFEMERYLDYCSEMLALAAKLAAIYAQTLDDLAVTEAASDIEQLATNLAQKIWQKIMILEAGGEDDGPNGTAPAPAGSRQASSGA
jgi:hypothetical protein